MIDLTLVVACLSLLLAGIAILDARRVAREQGNLQRRMLSLETARERDRIAASRKASVKLQLERTGGRTLLLTNEGPAEARYVRVEIAGNAMSRLPWVLKGEDVIEVLGAGASRTFPIMYESIPGTPEIQVSWDDDSGIPGRWRGLLA